MLTNACCETYYIFCYYMQNVSHDNHNNNISIKYNNIIIYYNNNKQHFGMLAKTKVIYIYFLKQTSNIKRTSRSKRNTVRT